MGILLKGSDNQMSSERPVLEDLKRVYRLSRAYYIKFKLEQIKGF